jgi:nicotinamidase/pyrazinamidase
MTAQPNSTASEPVGEQLQPAPPSGGKHALIVVDMQNCFCPGGNLPVAEGDTIIPRINELMPRYDVVVATQDWHPENHCSFAVTHGREPFSVVTVNGQEQTLWPVHCVAGTEDAALHPALDQRPIDLIVHKGTEPDRDAYSAFQGTGLAGYLRDLGVTDVDVVGLAYDYCVRSTAEDATRAGFHTRILADATRPVFPEKVPELEQSLVAHGIEIVK